MTATIRISIMDERALMFILGALWQHSKHGTLYHVSKRGTEVEVVGIPAEWSDEVHALIDEAHICICTSSTRRSAWLDPDLMKACSSAEVMNDRLRRG